MSNQKLRELRDKIKENTLEGDTVKGVVKGFGEENDPVAATPEDCPTLILPENETGQTPVKGDTVEILVKKVTPEWAIGRITQFVDLEPSNDNDLESSPKKYVMFEELVRKVPSMTPEDDVTYDYDGRMAGLTTSGVDKLLRFVENTV